VELNLPDKPRAHLGQARLSDSSSNLIKIKAAQLPPEDPPHTDSCPEPQDSLPEWKMGLRPSLLLPRLGTPSNSKSARLCHSAAASTLQKEWEGGLWNLHICSQSQAKETIFSIITFDRKVKYRHHF
jgi:hypothetical protein